VDFNDPPRQSPFVLEVGARHVILAIEWGWGKKEKTGSGHEVSWRRILETVAGLLRETICLLWGGMGSMSNGNRLI